MTIIPAEPTQSNAPNTLDALTNADSIRSMKDEELANWYFSEFFPNAPYCNKLECFRDSPCEQCLLGWLKQEVET